jgi:prepilin-type N-terminal cleavage/methylation domain-containing protein
MKKLHNRSKERQRIPQGMTLLELLVSVIVMGVAIAGITELLWVNATWSTRMLNKTDNLTQAKFFMQRLGNDLRTSNTVGDGINASSSYPSPSPVYTLGGDTLILQVPLFDANGFPLSNGPFCDVDTIVYQLLPDARDASGATYQMTKNTFRGNSDAALGNTIGEVVQNDVIGPLDKLTNKLAVFHYIGPDGIEVPASQISTSFPQASTISGVAVNLELNRTGDSTTQIDVNTINRSTFLIKSEFFLRNKLIPS